MIVSPLISSWAPLEMKKAGKWNFCRAYCSCPVQIVLLVQDATALVNVRPMVPKQSQLLLSCDRLISLDAEDHMIPHCWHPSLGISVAFNKGLLLALQLQLRIRLCSQSNGRSRHCCQGEQDHLQRSNLLRALHPDGCIFYVAGWLH